MPEVVKIHYAKTNMSAILSAVEAGEEFVIARGDHPVAKLVPLSTSRERQLGTIPFRVPDSFCESLPPEEISLWEGA